jgi:hypothetical protein
LAHHAARVDPSAGSDAAGVAQGHSHQASASTERQQAAGDQSSLAAGGLFANPDGNKHGDHEAAEIKSKVSADVVEKRCTTTYTGKNALIAYDGERKCDCAKKAKAAEEAAKRAAVDEVVTQTSVWQAPEGACPACLARSLGSVEGEICPAVPAVGGGMPADDLEQAVIDALVTIDSGEVDRSREDSPWQSRLQIAGLTLAAAGVAVIPLVWKRRRDEEQAIDEAWRRDGDWLGGCFHVEALAR